MKAECTAASPPVLVLQTCPLSHWPRDTQITHKLLRTHKRKCGENAETHNENFKLGKGQPAPAWGWVNSGLLYFMPPHHRGPLNALGPFKNSTTPFTAQRCLLAPPPIPSHPLWGEDLKQRKARTMYNGPFSTTHDPVMKDMREGMRGREGGMRGAGCTCKHLASRKRDSSRRYGVHANCVLLSSATRERDPLTKAQQMDDAGSQSSHKKCAVMRTTFFRTKTLCSHGHAWLHVRRRPSTIALDPGPTQSSTVLPWLFSSSSPSFSMPHICVWKDISVLPAHFFTVGFRGNGMPTPNDSALTANVLHLSVIKGLCYFIFPSESHSVLNFTARPVKEPLVLCDGSVPSTHQV